MPEIGGNVRFHPMMVYALAPFLTVLPVSETVIRLPTALAGLTDVILLDFIGARIFQSARWGLLAAALLALTPSHFMHSRIAMDDILPGAVRARVAARPAGVSRAQASVVAVCRNELSRRRRLQLHRVDIMMPLYLVMTLVVIGIVGGASVASGSWPWPALRGRSAC